MGQKLGQHFLKNTSAITRIIDALDLQREETVIEIGPGRGALTLPLAERCAEIGCKVVAIEKDDALFHRLISLQVDKLKNVDIVRGDVLTELSGVVATYQLTNLKTYKLVGNIPYYITGALLRTIGELEHKPLRTVLMVQREVAERVAAQPPHMNLLAAATQIWADVEILFTLPPEDFDPPPKVESAVITLKIKHQSSKIEKEELNFYYRFIHAAFQQPRKTLLNNIMPKMRTDADTANQKLEILDMLQKFGYTEKTRAQELSIEQLVALSRIF